MKKNICIYFLIFSCILILICSSCDAKNGSKASDATIASTPTMQSTLQPTTQPTTQPTQDIPSSTITPGKLTYANGIASEEAPKDQIMICNLNAAPTHCQIFNDMSIQFFPSTAFNEVSICCPSYSDNNGTLTFSLYAWMGSYEATVNSQAINSKTFENYADNALLSLKIEEALPDGEYLLVINTPDHTQGVGTWCKTGSFEGQKVYANGGYLIGEQQDEIHVELRVSYINTPNNMYGPVSK